MQPHRHNRNNTKAHTNTRVQNGGSKLHKAAAAGDLKEVERLTDVTKGTLDASNARNRMNPVDVS